MIEFFLDNLNYWTILLGMMIESSFIPFPSEIIVPPAAWLALGADSDMNIVMVVIVATLGADLGALINYFLAKWLGRPIVYKFADSRVGHLTERKSHMPKNISASTGSFPLSSAGWSPPYAN